MLLCKRPFIHAVYCADEERPYVRLERSHRASIWSEAGHDGRTGEVSGIVRKLELTHSDVDSYLLTCHLQAAGRSSQLPGPHMYN